MPRAAIGVLLSAALLSGGCARAPRCDRLLLGGVVHGPTGPQRVALAIREGRVLGLVPSERTKAWRARAAEVTDLKGAHVYPGFVDSHGHLTGYGAALEQVDLTGAASFAEVVSRARARADTLPRGAWVLGRGWDQNLWPDKSFPEHEELSKAIPDHPVLLRRVDGHAVLANAKALAAAGIDRTTPDPPGGRIVRGAGGAPTGVLVDAAADRVLAIPPPPSAADLERRILLASQHLAAYGLTGIHDAGTGREELAALRRLQQSGRLPVRVYAMLDGSDSEQLGQELPGGPSLSRDGMLAVRAVKLYADGALGSRGAWLSAPYTDEPGNRGLQVTPAAELEDVIRRATRAGFQPCVHAIGDAAVTEVLDVYERVLGPGGAGLRPRIEHSQVVRDEDVARFARLGVVAAVQPVHCTSDMPWARSRLGESRIAWAYRWRSFVAAGVHLCLGSDVPMESPDPRLGLFAAIARRRPEMATAAVWNPGEALSLEEAVAGFTSGSAFASFSDAWCGTLAPGSAADLTILDRDLAAGEPEGILGARVLRTVVRGRDMFVAGSQT
jgi:predicted amidohydrolase YtcJ